MQYAANCSLLFTEQAPHERPKAARAAGFGGVEFRWPFAEPDPGQQEIDRFVHTIEDAGVSLVQLNFYAGDTSAGELGIVSLPDRIGEFRACVDVAVEIGGRLRVPGFTALYGVRTREVPPDVQDEIAVDNLAYAAAAMNKINAVVLLEPLSLDVAYPLRNGEDVAAIIERVRLAGSSNVGFLCDLFHLAANGIDIYATIQRHGKLIRHVQVADYPGRGEPGSGRLPIRRYLDAVVAAGYRGPVALEYIPTTSTTQSLRFLGCQPDGGGAV
jgi:hydroxypyruvate isomerase